MNANRTLAFAALGALLFPTLSAAADNVPASRNRGYVVDSRADVVRSGQGMCVRSGEWTPALAAAAAACRDCTPELCPVRAAALPPPRVAAAEPAPAAPPPREPQRFSLAADTLFDFDKAELKPEGKSLLDALVADIAGMNYERIAITGHADRIGSDDYNQRLSERRAMAVREYLLGANRTAAGTLRGYTGGEMPIDPQKISAGGVGEAEPVTQADECVGNKATRALIECLQPDRRVEIEVTGSK